MRKKKNEEKPNQTVISAQAYLFIDFFSLSLSLFLHFQIVHAMVENFAADLQVLLNRNHFTRFISCIFVCAKAGELCEKFDGRWEKSAKICSKYGVPIATIGVRTASVQARCCLLRYDLDDFALNVFIDFGLLICRQFD